MSINILYNIQNDIDNLIKTNVYCDLNLLYKIKYDLDRFVFDYKQNMNSNNINSNNLNPSNLNYNVNHNNYNKEYNSFQNNYINDFDNYSDDEPFEKIRESPKINNIKDNISLALKNIIGNKNKESSLNSAELIV